MAATGRALALRPASGALLLRRADSSLAATQQKDWARARPFEDIPGPKPLPLVGNVWRFFPFVGDLARLDRKAQQEKFYRTYGRIMKLTGMERKNKVYLFDPKEVEKVFRNEGKWPVRDGIQTLDYYRTVLRKDVFQGLAGTITSQGEAWRSIRSKVNQPLMVPQTANSYIAPIDQVSGDFIDRIRSLRDGQDEMPPDFIHHLFKWSLESIAMVALDARLGSLIPELAPNSEPQRMVTAVQIMLEGIYHLDFQPSLWRYVSTPEWRRLVSALDLFTDVSMKYVQQAMDRIRSKPIEKERELSILERLLLDNENPMVPVVIALDMLLGGIDTTAHAAALLLFHLAKSQDKQEKLFQELRRVLPRSKSQPITAAQLGEMKYLTACMKESMRLQPVTIGNVRELVTDLVLCNYQVPKGTDVFMCNMLMSNMEEHFPKAGRFIPERWLKGDTEQQQAHPFAFLPFGFGPRMCVGRRLAELQIQVLTAKIFRNFRVEYHHGVELVVQSRAINMVTSPLAFKMVDHAD